MSIAPRPHRLAPLVLLLVLGALRAPLAAQSDPDEPRDVAGTVVDVGSGMPVPGASVALVETRRVVFTDAQGRFVLRNLERGSHPLVVTQLGYDTLDTVLEVGDGIGSPQLQLRPNPVVLEGLRVVTDRLRSRRNAVATSVRAFDQRTLQTGAARNALEFIETRTSLMTVPCMNRLSIDPCAYVRGRPTPVSVYVDDQRVPGGLDFLQMLRPEDLYLVEVYSGGRYVRAYTNWYISSAAKSRRPAAPVLIW